MVEVAPTPPGFAAPALDADDLPAAPATAILEDTGPAAPSARASHPLEAWAEPGPRFEPVISRSLPGSGYLSATKSALEALEAGERRVRQLAGPPILHASERDRLRREREDAIEAERRAGPDPRGVLAAALDLRAEAQAEVDRVASLLVRARRHVADLERRQEEHTVVVAANDQTAAEALITALQDGAEAPPVVDVNLPMSFEAELRTARLARDRLEAEDEAARDLLTRREHGVARCAHGVLIAEAVELADQIIDQVQQLAEARADLVALDRLLVSENRRLNASAAAMPAVISRALYGGVDAALAEASSDWRARYDRLRQGKELKPEGIAP